MRLRSSSHSAKVLHCGDTSVHLRSSGIELACEAGFQRSMETSWFVLRLPNDQRRVTIGSIFEARQERCLPWAKTFSVSLPRLAAYR